MRSLKFPVLIFLAASLLVGCGWGGSSGAPDLLVDEPWARAAPFVSGGEGSGANSAVYLLLQNIGGTSDRLLGGRTETSRSVEIHESRLEDGVMRMRRVEGLEIPSGGQVALKPGGYHLMLLGLNQPLAEGDTILLSLDFEHSGPLDVVVPVRPMGGN